MKALFRMTVMLVLTGAGVYASAQGPVASVYKTKCALCHGATGAADTPAGKAFNVPSFSSEAVMKESDANLLVVARSGKGKMPAWQGKLSDDQLKDLISFIHTMQKK